MFIFVLLVCTIQYSFLSLCAAGPISAKKHTGFSLRFEKINQSTLDQHYLDPMRTNHDGSLLVGSSGLTVQCGDISHIDEGRPLFNTVYKTEQKVESIAVVPDDKYLFYTADKASVKLWDTRVAFKHVQSLPELEDISKLSVLPDKHLLASPPFRSCDNKRRSSFWGALSRLRSTEFIPPKCILWDLRGHKKVLVLGGNNVMPIDSQRIYISQTNHQLLFESDVSVPRVHIPIKPQSIAEVVALMFNFHMTEVDDIFFYPGSNIMMRNDSYGISVFCFKQCGELSNMRLVQQIEGYRSLCFIPTSAKLLAVKLSSCADRRWAAGCQDKNKLVMFDMAHYLSSLKSDLDGVNAEWLQEKSLVELEPSFKCLRKKWRKKIERKKCDDLLACIDLLRLVFKRKV